MAKSLQDKSPSPQYDVVIISDVHLGQKSRPKDKLDKFLKQLDCETLVMNGDIVDGLRISGRKKKKLSKYDLNIMDALNEKIAQGMKVIYVPGNHDEQLRKMDIYGKSFMGITFAEYYVHKTPAGKSFFISHGDQFDDHLQYTTKISSRLFKIGDFFGDAAINADRHINKISKAFLKREIGLQGFVEHGAYKGILDIIKEFNTKSSDKKLTSKDVLHILKRTNKMLQVPSTMEDDFKAAAFAHARKNGFSGVICGHTHAPKINTSSDGLIYANSGDWVRNFSALAMDKSGAWQIIRQPEDAPEKKKHKKKKSAHKKHKKKKDVPKHSAETKEMAKAINDIWPRKKFTSIYSGYKGP